MVLDSSALSAPRDAELNSTVSVNCSFSFAFGVAGFIIQKVKAREVSHFFFLVANANLFILK